MSDVAETNASGVSAGALEAVRKTAGLPATTVAQLQRLFEDLDRVIGYVSAIETSGIQHRTQENSWSG